jgi:hypothetical protein
MRRDKMRPFDLAPRYSRRPSFDFKLLLIYGVAMLLLFAAGRLVSVEMELTFTTVLASGLTMLSIMHRRAADWRWPGVGARHVAAALTNAAMLGLFLFAATPLSPPTSPRALPWYLGVLGAGLFNILENLRVIRVAKTDFEADCCSASGAHISIAITDREPAWKRKVRGVFSVLFMLVWLDAVAFFSVHGASVRDGSIIATATHSVRLVHGERVVYITPAQNQMRSILETIGIVGAPAALSALVFQYLIWVRLYPTRRPE